jgi:hypothetical protein
LAQLPQRQASAGFAWPLIGVGRRSLGGGERRAERADHGGAEFGRRNRAAEIEALYLVGVGVLEEVGLALGLDAFDGYPHAQLAAERNDAFDHGLHVAA